MTTENCLYALMHVVLWYHESRSRLIDFSFKIDLFYVFMVLLYLFLNRNELSFISHYLVNFFYFCIKCKTHLSIIEKFIYTIFINQRQFLLKGNIKCSICSEEIWVCSFACMVVGIFAIIYKTKLKRYWWMHIT